MDIPICKSTQDNLSRMQACPLLGPAIVSPIKLLFSVAEIVVAVAVEIFANLIWAFCKLAQIACTCACIIGAEERISLVAHHARKEFEYGIKEAGYSILNILTIGGVGFYDVFIKGAI